jgi:sulfite reductase alpha subunit-like flavoprotein
LIEEAHIIPKIKQRYYSIINDPFKGGVSVTDSLEIIFTKTKFIKNGKPHYGLCTSFMSDSENVGNPKQEVKIHFSSAYRVLKLPENSENDSTMNLLMIA